MTMTRKDYVLIADTIDSMNSKILISKKALVKKLCEAFENDNPRFKADSFTSACNWTETEEVSCLAQLRMDYDGQNERHIHFT